MENEKIPLFNEDAKIVLSLLKDKDLSALSKKKVLLCGSLTTSSLAYQILKKKQIF